MINSVFNKKKEQKRTGIIPFYLLFSTYHTILSWRLIPFFVATLVLIPVGVVVVSSFLSPTNDIWQHLIETTLLNLLINTCWLTLGVTSGSALLGVSLAWFTAVCEFPGRRIFSWALLLPLAIPAYVTAFVALGIFDFTGPVQTLLRSWFGSNVSWFPDIRSRMDIIIIMILAFYPYIYLLARNAFLTQGKRSLEVSQSLGLNLIQGFFKVTLPMARPWIISGMMLVLMETLADFGAVAVFNYDTLTTAIYKAWFSMFSFSAASQLASLLIVIVFVLIIIEQRFRARMRYSETKQSGQIVRIVLVGWRAWSVTYLSFSVLFFAFLLPIAQLIIWASHAFTRNFNQHYFELLWHSLLLSGFSAILICCVALSIIYGARRHSNSATNIAVRIATIGYALPGTVLAIGIFISFAWLDQWFGRIIMQLFRIEIGSFFQGTLLAMLFAYAIRFLAVGYNSIDSSMQRITSTIDEASMGLGIDGFKMLQYIHFPVLKSGIFTAAVLVFIDVMKEMPITLMTRPFDWDTLAIRIFEMTSEGEWEQAALPAVTLVLAGIFPIMMLMKKTEQ